MSYAVRRTTAAYSPAVLSSAAAAPGTADAVTVTTTAATNHQRAIRRAFCMANPSPYAAREAPRHPPSIPGIILGIQRGGAAPCAKVTIKAADERREEDLLTRTRRLRPQIYCEESVAAIAPPEPDERFEEPDMSTTVNQTLVVLSALVAKKALVRW